MGLTVWCVCVGDKYTDEDVKILRRMVRYHLHQRHWFRCLSDRKIIGIDCLVVDPWPGWWSKLKLFEATDGQNLYLDLDTVVTGALDGLLSKPLSMPLNWSLSGHGGSQSSVMSWGKDYSFLPAEFDPDQLSEPENGNYGYYGPGRLWGDQEYITERMGDQVVSMQGVYSYKYHCRQAVPCGARVVCFHGDPKPDKVSDRWVIESRSTRICNSHTRSPTLAPCARDSLDMA
jgi:hypothetical protein